MEDEVGQAEKFLEFANTNYEIYKKKWAKYLSQRGLEFDEDVFQDTIIKVYDFITKNGIKDDSDEGLANYWFKSFQMNIKREKQYSRNANRDLNVDAYEVLDMRTNGDEELQLKMLKESYSDFALLYILEKVEKEFDFITFWCFRLYYILNKMTYSKLKAITKVKDCKKRCVEVKKWLAENITEDEIKAAFNKWYEEEE